MKVNTYVYIFEGNLYLNITNKCSNNCRFCIRHGREGLEGNRLWLSKEPDFEDMKTALSHYDIINYSEAVFCGFGEPTEKLEVLKQTAAYLKSLGMTVRLNTNGQGSLTNGKDIVPELKGLIDVVSISLNASDSRRYQSVCASKYGESAYSAVLAFAKAAAAQLPRVIMSVVDEGDDEENKRCENICNACGAQFRLRTKI